MFGEKSEFSSRRWAAAGAAFALVAASPLSAYGDCRPKVPRPPVTLTSMGACQFDSETLNFAGDSLQQAQCLLRPVKPLAKLGPVLDGLPMVLATRVGSRAELPDRIRLSTFLWEQDLDRDFATRLWQPMSRANDNDPQAPVARYFVIHDTSGPYFGSRPFPADLDTHPKINNLDGHRCTDGWEGAHVFINRSGAMLLGHDFEVPWRATKFERGRDFDGALKGLFIHVEMIQPRRVFVVNRRRYDSGAPEPGFTHAQYDRLALVYVIASVRAEKWLIPAFHAVLDGEIRNGHDDPQNFDLDAFARSLEKVLDQIDGHEHPELSFVP